MGITIQMAILFDMETTTVPQTSIGVTMVTKMIEVGPIFLLRIGKFLLMIVEELLRELKICFRK